MKMMKKVKGIVALLLAIAMIVSGIYLVESEGSEAQAGTESGTEANDERGATVDPGMLTVKVQPGKSEDGSVKALRFITSVNSLDYKTVGFVVDWEGNTGNPITYAVKDNTVFERIESSADESYMSYKFSPKVVDTSAEYFATGKLNVTGKESTLYTVMAYVVTFENETIYGTSRCVSYDDAISTSYTNVSYVSSATKTVGATITGVKSSASTSDTETYDATVIGSDANANGDGTYNIHVRVQDVNPNDLPSATTFTFGTNETAIYRNLYTSYDAAGDQDETWWKEYYTENADETEFVIATSADLYGLATLVNAGADGISGKTFYVVSDIDVNGSSSKQWTPIGNSSDHTFAGTFDGQGHTIRGLYASGTENIALFGLTGDCTVTDFSLEDSTFTGTGWPVAGVLAQPLALTNVSKIYCNATVTGQYNSGGIIGLIPDTNSTEVQVDECWFAGSVTTTQAAAGIIGKVNQADAIVNNCLNSGTISDTSVGRAAGICADLAKNSKLTISDCLNTGTISGKSKADMVSYVWTTNTTLTIKNSYAKEVEGVSSVATSCNSTVLSEQFEALTEDNLKGANGYTNTFLNFDDFETEEVFDGIWTAVEGGTPELSYFSSATEAELPHTIRQDTRWYKGDSDTTTTSYTITTPEELYGFAKLSENNTFLGKTINLENDITINATDNVTWETVAPFYREWTQIGSTSSYFEGTFNGNENAISGVYALGTTEMGLFGATGARSRISDIKLENSYFEGTANVGSIVGSSNGDLTNVFSDATVVGTLYSVGGLVGEIRDVGNGYDNTRVYTNCWFDGIVKSAANGIYRMGGIAGYIHCPSSSVTFEQCYNSGLVTLEDYTSQYGRLGGIVGDINGPKSVSISNSFNAGQIISAKSNVRGSIVGFAGKNFSINNVYATTESCLVSDVHRKVGNDETKATGIILNVSKELLLGTGGYINTALNFDDTTTADAYDGYWTARKNDVPALRMFVDETERTTDFEGLTRKDISWYTSTAAGTYTLTTEEQLWGFGLLGQSYSFDGQTIQLGADMDINDADADTVASWKAGNDTPSQQWIPIGSNEVPFKGTFDGQGNTINGIYYQASGLGVGLFGEIFANATVKNVAITNSYFKNTNPNSSADAETGSAVGRSEGIVQNVYSNAIVESAQGNAGGIVGVVQYFRYATSLTRTIENCWFAGEVTVASYHAGGIVGRVQGASSSTKVNNEQVYTEVTITNCLNTGSVTAKDAGTHGRAAGIVGCIQGYCEATISNTLNTGTITAPKNAYSTVAYKNSSQATIDVQATTYEVAGKTVVTTGSNSAGIAATNSCAVEELYSSNADNINLDKTIWTFYEDKTPELTVLAGYLAN